MKLSKAMRGPRKAKVISGGDEAWWYIEPNGITVVSSVAKGLNPIQVRLTRRQLERALEVMGGETESPVN